MGNLFGVQDKVDRMSDTEVAKAYHELQDCGKNVEWNNWNNWSNFWTEYCRKTHDWSVGPFTVVADEKTNISAYRKTLKIWYRHFDT